MLKRQPREYNYIMYNLTALLCTRVKQGPMKCMHAMTPTETDKNWASRGFHLLCCL